MTDMAGRRIWVMAKGYLPDEGGMQTYAREVAEGYAALGADVTVFTQTSAGPRQTRIGAVFVIDIGPGKSPAVPLRLLARMRAAPRPDAIHATTWRTGVLPMLLRLPFSVTVHGREMARPTGLAARVMRRVLRRAERIVAVSHYTAARLIARVPDVAAKVQVAWNGTSRGLDDSAAKVVDPLLILTLCRLEPRKNVAAALRAASACAAAGARFRYVVAGRGPALAELQAEHRRLRLHDHVELAGFVSDAEAASLYARASIFLHPQVAEEGGRDFEGFGITIADAMAQGCACIVGRDGGAAELVEDGSGIIVDGRDDRAIEKALSELIADPALRADMGRRARDRAALFSWEAHCRIAIS